jgi:hypothetical protein
MDELPATCPHSQAFGQEVIPKVGAGIPHEESVEETTICNFNYHFL